MDVFSPGRRPLRTLSRPVPLAQIAYERVRRGLAAGGELHGLDRLIEQDLAARLEMSRTPVRDALHRLALMGFLEPSPGGGYVRRTFTVRDAREHYELRVLLEPVAAQLAAGGSAGRRVPGAENLLAHASKFEWGDDARFHILVAELSGNDVLARVIANVMERLIGFGVREANGDNAPAVVGAHRRIAQAIGRGDASAQEEMAGHLHECEEALVAHLGAPVQPMDAVVSDVRPVAEATDSGVPG
jgi:DNA-binding GntR family transcriptional regulator